MSDLSNTEYDELTSEQKEIFTTKEMFDEFKAKAKKIAEVVNDNG